MSDFSPNSKIDLKAVWLQVNPENKVIAVAGEYDVITPSGLTYRKQQVWNDPPMLALADAQKLIEDYLTEIIALEGVS